MLLQGENFFRARARARARHCRTFDCVGISALFCLSLSLSLSRSLYLSFLSSYLNFSFSRRGAFSSRVFHIYIYIFFFFRTLSLPLSCRAISISLTTILSRHLLSFILFFFESNLDFYVSIDVICRTAQPRRDLFT